MPLRDDEGSPLDCTPDICAAGGKIPHYSVRDGRLVKGEETDSDLGS